MTHSQFKQWFLFQLMDADIPSWANFCCVTSYGQVLIFQNHPKTIPCGDGGFHDWMDDIDSGYGLGNFKPPLDEKLDTSTLKLPEGYCWTKTVIKL